MHGYPTRAEGIYLKNQSRIFTQGTLGSVGKGAFLNKLHELRCTFRVCRGKEELIISIFQSKILRAAFKSTCYLSVWNKLFQIEVTVPLRSKSTQKGTEAYSSLNSNVTEVFMFNYVDFFSRTVCLIIGENWVFEVIWIKLYTVFFTKVVEKILTLNGIPNFATSL